MKESTRRTVRRVTRVLGFVAVVAAIDLAARHLDFRAVWAAGVRMGAGRIGVAFAFVALQALLQMVRFLALVPSSWRVDFARAGYATAVAQLINNVAPARTGEIVKVVALERAARSREASVAGATGVLTGDKVIELLSIATLAVAFGIPGLHDIGIRSGDAALVVLASVALPAIALFVIWVARPSWIARVQASARRFAGGLRTLARPIAAGSALAASVGAWLTEAIALVVLARGVDVDLTLRNATVTIVALNLAIFVPVAPANVGAYEGAVAFALTRFGVRPEPALAIAVVHHALQILAMALWLGVAWLVQRARGGPAWRRSAAGSTGA